MARLKVALVALVILPGFVSGQQSPLNHTVVRGETLWALAQRYYQDPFLWPRIWEANRADVVDPDLILPDQVLVIPGMAGPAAITDVGVQPAQQPAAMDPAPEPVGDPRLRDRTVFYRDPDAARGVARVAPPLHPAVPRHTVYGAEWLVMDGDESDAIGRIDAFRETGELRTALPYTRVQVRMDGSQSMSVGDRLQSFRPGRTLGSIGEVMVPTSALTVTRVEEAGVVAVVLDAFDRVREGDMIRPAPMFDLQPGETPEAITAGGSARLLGFGEYHAVQNMGDIAFLDRGAAQGVKIGDEYILYLDDSEGRSDDVVGRLQVVGTRVNTASARIVGIEGAVFEAGLTVHLDRKMR